MKMFIVWVVLGLFVLAPVGHLAYVSWDMWVNMNQSVTANIAMQIAIVAAAVFYVAYVWWYVRDDDA